MATQTEFLESRDFTRIARAVEYLDTHWQSQPRLAQVAKHAGLSDFHFNRLFRRWAGLTPKQYLAHLTAGAAQLALAHEPSVMDAALAVGLSGPGRLHDLMITVHAMTPGEIRAGGEGVSISYGFSASPFGTVAISRTPRGIAGLEFVDAVHDGELVHRLRRRWPNAMLQRDDDEAASISARLWGRDFAPRALHLHVRGTNFELKVWRALLELGERHTSYGELAQAIGAAGSARAVGNAVGANPVAWLIPCHRVLRADGNLGGYRWGAGRKRAMIAWERMPHAGT